MSLIAGLLLTIGGLAALQNAMIIAAFPFSFIVILMMIALYIELSHEQTGNGAVYQAGNISAEKRTLPFL